MYDRLNVTSQLVVKNLITDDTTYNVKATFMKRLFKFSRATKYTDNY